MNNFGEVLVTILDRSTIDDHFSGHMAGPCKMVVETASGSQYAIALPEGESTEVEHTDEAMSGTFHVRPGSVVRNGQQYTGLVGFNLQHGALLVLDPDTKCMLLRSSSIAKVDILS